MNWLHTKSEREIDQDKLEAAYQSLAHATAARQLATDAGEIRAAERAIERAEENLKEVQKRSIT
jgi:hypothetical protein